LKVVILTKYGAPDVLQVNEISTPKPDDHQVLIKIYATTVTAVDTTFRKGNEFFARLATGIIKPRIRILGTEFSGVIESVGKKVTLFKQGDPVFGDSGTHYGTYAEFICMSEKDIILRKPENLSYEEATAIPYGALTALPFLRDSGNIQKGQQVLIIGTAGNVGIFAVQLARYYGADVTGVCSHTKSELVMSLGAKRVIDYTKEDFLKRAEPYDIIFDTIGKYSFPQCKHLLNPKGIYLTTVLGFPILLHMMQTSLFSGKKAKLSLTGMRSTEDRFRDLNFITDLIKQKQLKPIIDKTYPFEEISEAHKYVDLGHKTGSLIITIKK